MFSADAFSTKYVKHRLCYNQIHQTFLR